MKTIKTLLLAASLTALAILATPASAETTRGRTPTAAITMAGTAASEMTDGEVRRVDKAQGKVTLKHGDIKNLDMPGMTMVFSVKNKAMLDNLKPGDKIKFKAVDDGGKLTVVEMVPAN